MNSQYKKVIILILLSIISLSMVGCNKNNNEKVSNNENELISPKYDVKNITSDVVKEIEKGMTYKIILKKLGKTRDIGLGEKAALYTVDKKLNLIIAFKNINDVFEDNGEVLLKNAEPIKKEPVTGIITDTQPGKDEIIFLSIKDDKNIVTYVTINKETKIKKDNQDTLLNLSEIKVGSLVEVTFKPNESKNLGQNIADILKIINLP